MDRCLTLAGISWLIIAAGCNRGAVCPQPASSITATPTNDPLYLGNGDPYAPGELPTKMLDLNVCEQGAPVALRIFAPAGPGRYPVVVFQHGFISQGIWYSEILSHVATHGFVVVAPQMYSPNTFPTFVPPAEEEIDLAIRVLDWLPGHLNQASGVEADTTRLGLVGHSRGGKVAWGILTRDVTRASAIAGLDPVDGAFLNQQRVIQGPFNFPFPTLVIGAGLGGNCAPEGDNHVQFYEASAPPAWHVVAPRAGHADFYDSNCSGCGLISAVCQKGDSPEDTRRLAAGLLVAFFRAALQGDTTSFAALQDESTSPIPVEIESKH